VKRVIRSFSVLLPLGLLIGAALIGSGAVASSADAATPKKFTLYAVATRVQFFDRSDDRERGSGSNPFNVDTKALLPIARGADGAGPSVGDNALYSFKLYTSANLKTSAGTAVYTCTFNFTKHALCQAFFDLKGGTLYSTGPIAFDAKRFTLGVSTGTGTYIGARGQVSTAPVTKAIRKDMHRLDFVLS